MKKTLLAVAMSLFIGIAGYAQKEQSSDYNLRKAFELLEENKVSEALEFITKQIEENPNSADSYVLRARIYQSQEKYGNALTDINKAVKLWKKGNQIQKYSVYWWRADIYGSLEMYDKALADYDEAYNFALKEADEEDIAGLLSQRAQLLYLMEEYDKADESYRLMLKHNEANQFAMIGLARNMIARKNYQGAIDMLDRCEKFDETYDEIYRFRMQAYDGIGEKSRAIDDVIKYYLYSSNASDELATPILKKHLTYALAKVNEMINNNSENMRWKTLRTTIYELGHDYASAIAEYNNIEKEYGSSSSIYYFRSKCYNSIGDSESAIADITKCIEMGDGKEVAPLVGRATFLVEADRFEEALKDFSKIIEIIPTAAYAYAAKGRCYELMKDEKMAMDCYNTGIDIDKSYPLIYFLRGRLHFMQDDMEPANKDFEVVLERDTVVNPDSYRQFALHFLNRDEEALEWMEKVILEDADNEGSYYNKACLLSLMGKKEEAIAALKVAFDKGYRSFKHIDQDEDMDAIRNHPDFIALIEEYKAKTRVVVKDAEQPQDEVETISEVQMKKMYSGVYEVPCDINGLSLKFIFDTGASDVSISSVEASFMLKNGYLTKEDIKGKEYFSTATGEIHEGTKIRLREIKIGDATLKNVEASVVQNQQAPLLLGQSVLERFGTITIDNINSKLVIKQ